MALQEEKPVQVTRSQVMDLIHNATSRAHTLFQKLLDPRRDIDQECGYQYDQVPIEVLKRLFDVHAIATRVVEVMPMESWQVQPDVFEDDDPDVQTPFEKDFEEMCNGLRGKSWFKGQEGNPFWECLKRADVLSGIGHFGVILLGFDDGLPYDQPVAMLQEYIDMVSAPDTSQEMLNPQGDPGIDNEDDNHQEQPYGTKPGMGSIDAQYQAGFGSTDVPLPVATPGTKRKLVYMRPFDESLVQVIRLESNPASPRFGHPLAYRITLQDINQDNEQSVTGTTMANPEVHWTRVIHIADNTGNSEVFGTPRQNPVYRHLANLYKLYAAAPEMFWRGAMNGLSFETHPQLGGDVTLPPELKDNIENYRNSLQRDLVTVGMTVKTLAPTLADATPYILSQIEAICIKIACPKRVFMGSERGELASSQDDSSWNDKIRSRENGHCTPRIITPTTDRLIATCVLSIPKGVKQEPGTDPAEDQTQNPDTGDLATNAFPDSLQEKKPSDTPDTGNTPPAFGKPAEVKPPVKPSMGDPNKAKKIRPGYQVVWPDLDSETASQKAAIALQITQALAAYVSGNLEAVIELKDWLVMVIGWTEDRARAVIQSKLDALGQDDRLTPDPQEAQQKQMDMQSQQMQQDHELKKAALDKAPAGLVVPGKEEPGQFKGGQPPQLAGKKPVPVANQEQDNDWENVEEPEPETVLETNSDRVRAILRRHQLLLNYSPNQPRDSQGRFGSGSGSKVKTTKGETLHGVTRSADKVWVDSDGHPAPEHIQKLGIPPAWKNVHVNPDPNGTLFAKGVDSKGRVQSKYSANHEASQTAAKFGRVSELRKKREGIFKEVEKDSKNPATKENAECLKVIMQTGIRPGSSKDTGAEHKSYGATTLLGKHVQTKEDGSTVLKFATGKNKGREVEFPINDPATAAMLKFRSKNAGESGNLFGTDATSLRDYSKNKDGKGFKTKDHRTALGTETAVREIQARPRPKTKTEYKAQVKEVATVVSKTLGNTPSIALKSYIDPTVFSGWNNF